MQQGLPSRVGKHDRKTLLSSGNTMHNASKVEKRLQRIGSCAFCGSTLGAVELRCSLGESKPTEAFSVDHSHARFPLSFMTIRASPYVANRLSTVFTEANGSL